MTAEVFWHAATVEREARWAAAGLAGATVWFTGLSGSGKSTVADAVATELLRRRRAVYVLDGDNVRHGLNADLGFSAADRAENVRRIGEVARLMGSSPWSRSSARTGPIGTASGRPTRRPGCASSRCSSTPRS